MVDTSSPDPFSVPHLRLSVGDYTSSRDEISLSFHTPNNGHYIAILPPVIAWHSLKWLEGRKGQEPIPDIGYIAFHEMPDMGSWAKKEVDGSISADELNANSSWFWILKPEEGEK